MANFKDDIVDAVDNDKILSVYIFKMEDDDDYDRFCAANIVANRLVSYEEALKVLNYDYNDGYGGQDCHDILMWSAERVYYVHEYDGATCIRHRPRNPIKN